MKAWSNSIRIQYAERLVFLKIAFEAITQTEKTHESVCKLREIFEALPNTSARDSKILVWSPEEKRIRTWTWREKTCCVTDLEHWFRTFGDARNDIIHEGKLPQFEYSLTDSNFNGHLFWTAEYLLRGVIKVLLEECGYCDAWRSERRRTIKATVEVATSNQGC